VLGGILAIGFWLSILGVISGVTALASPAAMAGILLFIYGRVAYAREYKRRYGSFWQRRWRTLKRYTGLAVIDLRRNASQPLVGVMPAGPTSNLAGSFAAQYASASMWRSMTWLVRTMSWFPIRDLLIAIRAWRAR
jgi:hypothetical protein